MTYQKTYTNKGSQGTAWETPIIIATTVGTEELLKASFPHLTSDHVQ